MAAFYRNPVYVAGMAIVAIAAYMLTQPDDTPTKTVAKKKTTLSTKTDVQYLPSDYTAKFTAVPTAPKDLFKPLVARPILASNRLLGPAGNLGIPGAFAGGESNWVYSGMAVVDGVPQGLVENQTTNDSAFLKTGQRWKACTVTGITADTISLIGPDSSVIKVKVKYDTGPAAGAATTPAAAATAPAAVNPPLAGDIGNPAVTVPATGGTGRGRGRGGRGRGQGAQPQNPTDNG